ncbi:MULTISPECIES: hypothetical protein [unclassified Streptomyces]|uniref:hypothetical protein n=1 Tax=Streptomycetaceae TaxID=2062 RepID=UPI002E7A175A|nr:MULTISPECIES: hypothetical protein [unclassified Streptomyces]MED7948361.1 hypothetical protein [Streptomyces sp. BE303]MEE1823916.1 hypothetical protein [Streptomyces sp. BE20]
MSASVNLTHLAAELAVDDAKVTPGLLGFVVFAVLGVATWFLAKSMNRQFKKVDFVEQPEASKE